MTSEARRWFRAMGVKGVFGLGHYARFLGAVFCLVVLAGCASTGQHPGSEAKNLELTQHALQALSAFEVDPRPLIGAAPAPGVYLGLALDGQSPAFDGDIRRARDRLFLQAVKGPTVLLSNLKVEPGPEPHADFKTMPRVAKAAGQWLSKQALLHRSPALAVVTISAHGGQNTLLLRIGNEYPLALLLGDYLARFLGDLGSGPVVVIISACHAGSLIPVLRAPNRVIIAAAAADRVSFGCGADSTSSIFMQALLDKDLNRQISLEELFKQARNRVIGLEMRSKIAHSLPEMDVGADMEAFAATPIAKWSTALREFRLSKP